MSREHLQVFSHVDALHHSCSCQPLPLMMACSKVTNDCTQELTHRLGGRAGALPQVFLHGQHLGVSYPSTKIMMRNMMLPHKRYEEV